MNSIDVGQHIISNEDYHESPGLSSSGLKLFRRSPLHYWERYLNPEREPRKTTPALILGNQIHKAVLEPESYFSTYYPLLEKYDIRTKQGKADYEYHESKALEEGKVIISAENHKICQAIAEAVHTNNAASTLFEMDGLIENSFYWRDPSTDILMKCRPDKLILSDSLILDLKSTECAAYEDFQRSTINYDYYISAAFYRRGVKAITGIEITNFILCCFEKEPPYASAFYALDNDFLEIGDRLIDEQLPRFKECLNNNTWPGYPERIQAMSPPQWFLNKYRKVQEYE